MVQHIFGYGASSVAIPAARRGLRRLIDHPAGGLGQPAALTTALDADRLEAQPPLPGGGLPFEQRGPLLRLFSLSVWHVRGVHDSTGGADQIK